MTGHDRPQADGSDANSDAIGTRRATISSEVEAPATVAAAIVPDNTDEIDTRVEDGRVVTTIERPTTGGLEATVDDYVVALDVATATAEHAAGVVTGIEESRTESTTDTTSDAQHADRHDTDTL